MTRKPESKWRWPRIVRLTTIVLVLAVLVLYWITDAEPFLYFAILVGVTVLVVFRIGDAFGGLMDYRGRWKKRPMPPSS